MKASNFRALVLFLLASIFYNSSAQDEFNFKEWFVEAESYFLFEEYSDALPLYQRLLSEDPDNSNIKFKIGICYLNNPYQKERASKFLLEASENISKNYKPNNFKERFAPPEVYYYLGQAYRVTGNLNKALEYFSLFKKNMDPEIFDVQVIDDEISSCEVAKRMLLYPVYKEQATAGNVINSRFTELNPVLSGDGNTIVFTRELQFYDAVFISKKDVNGNWSPPYNLTPDFQLDGNSYCTGISYEGNEIFIYRSDNFDGNIYSTRLINERWQPLQRLNALINTKYWESHASPSPDGKYLYFTSNRKGGYGGLDIYRSMRLSNGDWGTPVNLGPIVNSPYNEDCPFISPNDNKLFFSSLGHNSMGGYDIFVSELIGPKNWSKPANMGYPVNTTADDLYFCPVNVGDYTGMISLYDANSTMGLKDIYFLKVFNSVLPRKFNVIGKVNSQDLEIKRNNNFTASIVDTKEGKIIDQSPIDSSGNFTLVAPQGQYRLLIDGEGIKPVTVPVELILTQKNNNVELMEIQIEEDLTEKYDAEAIVAKLPEINLVGQDFIKTDSVPVIINLRLEPGNDLIVETFVDEKLRSKEEYLIKKEDFGYRFTPEPGMNKVVFTIRDKQGNVATKEVQVYYEPVEITEPIVVSEPEVDPATVNEVAMLADSELSKYLMTADDLKYNSLAELYAKLLEVADENEFTPQDIDSLFAIILTQREKNEFLEQSSLIVDILDRNNPDIIGYNYPISIIKAAKPEGQDSLFSYEEKVILLTPVKFKGSELFEYILSFSDEKNVNIESEQRQNEDIFSNLIEGIGIKQAEVIIDKAATTRELEQYYFNLLLSASPALKKILTEINFEATGIDNSIDLVEFLFKKAKVGEISPIDLIAQIEKSLQEEEQNLTLFKEALANAATGELKLDIMEYEQKSGSLEIAGILENILNNVNTKGYSKAEVYDLLIKMIGIEDVGMFVEEMRKYSSGSMDSLLSVVEQNHVSTPLEIIQYLLSESPYFDFTDSDINSLLIRMLLEKGMEGHGLTKESSYSKELMGKNRLLTSVVLANVLIIILIILFWRRKNKKR